MVSIATDNLRKAMNMGVLAGMLEQYSIIDLPDYTLKVTELDERAIYAELTVFGRTSGLMLDAEVDPLTARIGIGGLIAAACPEKKREAE